MTVASRIVQNGSGMKFPLRISGLASGEETTLALNLNTCIIHNHIIHNVLVSVDFLYG